eukprot:GHUV01028786.1.p1 GENE.GHUV01028786.1~~GHUV01028786.1.p1  ORF type:complete len:184 (+),score=19.54 GHUV01028786.1:298-849(+)
MNDPMPDAAAERTAGEASSSGAGTNSGSSGTKPIVVLVIGKLCSTSYCTCSSHTVGTRPLVSDTFQTHAQRQLATRVSAGMAGSGKTTLIQRINSHMHQKNMAGYIINLDPAVTHLPYGANIDIRDTVREERSTAANSRHSSSSLAGEPYACTAADSYTVSLSRANAMFPAQQQRIQRPPQRA